MQKTVFGVWLLIAAVVSVQAETLEDELSARSFEKAGLHKLSKEELTYLNEILGRAKPTEKAFGKEQLADQPNVAQEGTTIHANIIGDFTGWKGKTLFRLNNGQVWQQRIGGRYSRPLKNPAVTIEKGRFGYYLILDITGRQVGVRRIK